MSLSLEKLPLDKVTLTTLLIPCGLLCASGCSNSMVLDRGWTGSGKVAETEDALVSSFTAHRFNQSVLTLRYEERKRVSCKFLGEDGETWQERLITLVDAQVQVVFVHPFEPKVIFADGAAKEVLSLNFVLASLQESTFHPMVSHKLSFSKQEIFGDVPNVSFSELIRYGPRWGGGTVSEMHFWIPYSIRGDTHFDSNGRGVVDALGPFEVGIFHSADAGNTWQREKVFDFDANGRVLAMTKSRLYLFSDKRFDTLGCAWRDLNGGQWSDFEVVTKKLTQNAWHMAYGAAGSDETVHVIWLDKRNESINLLRALSQGLGGADFEVYYRQRKDSGGAWSRETLLSRGLCYSYAPRMSVEGSRIVVVWSGYPKRTKSIYGEFHPSEVYITISSDNGQTWTGPKRVTDVANKGFCAARPQVILHKGRIHLWYIQGKLQDQKVAPGLRGRMAVPLGFFGQARYPYLSSWGNI